MLWRTVKGVLLAVLIVPLLACAEARDTLDAVQDAVCGERAAEPGQFELSSSNQQPLLLESPEPQSCLEKL